MSSSRPNELNNLFLPDPSTLLDLSDPEAWKLPDHDGDHHDAATAHADLHIPSVYCQLEHVHLSLPEEQAVSSSNAVATSPAASMHTMPSHNRSDERSIGMQDVDKFMEFMEESTLEGEATGAGRLDTDAPLCQNVKSQAPESLESRQDPDWCEHCQSICITKTDYRNVPASPRVATPRTSFQATSSSIAVTVPTSITVFNTDSNQLSRHQQRANPGHLNLPDRARTFPAMNDKFTSGATFTRGVSFDSPPAATFPKRPMFCKPLTAYNYFYRVERDNIVNGMASADDPLPPVDQDVSLEKQEKLLHQHWYVESTKMCVSDEIRVDTITHFVEGMRIQNGKSDRIEKHMVSLIF
jgi:hypothetical protein